MKSAILKSSLLTVAGVSIFIVTANSQENGGGAVFRAQLSGYNEVASLSSAAQGQLFVFIDDRAQTVSYRLTYSGFATPVAQSHLHLGQQHTNGGVSVFLCTNLGNGPAGTAACPEGEGVVEGMFTVSEVLGPVGQGIEPGAIDELIDAVRAGAIYVNVHTQAFPAGEIRGQLR